MGYLAGSVDGACYSSSQSFEFEPHAGNRNYLKKKKSRKKKTDNIEGKSASFIYWKDEKSAVYNVGEERGK